MMRRGKVASGVTMIQRGAGAHRIVPPGPCWILEGSHWVALIWHEAQERHMAEISMRDYTAFVEQGRIQHTTAHDEWSDSKFDAFRREIPVRANTLSAPRPI